MSPTLAFDIGGTHLRGALVDGDGKILIQEKRESGRRPPDAIAADAADLAGALESEAGVQAEEVGVALAGMISTPRHLVEVAPNLGWRRIPFRDVLQQACGARPVRLVNDLAAAATAEARVGVAQGDNPVFCAFVGTGVGSAFVVDGSPLGGHRGVAGELGHIKVSDAQGPLCGCGARGCLEAHTGGRHLLEQAQKAVDQGDAPDLARRLAQGDALSMALVDEMADDPSSFASGLIRRSAAMLGTALANIITLLNPRCVVLGGGVLQHSPRLRAQLEDVAAARANPPALKGCSFKDALLGDDAGLIGAALLARDAQLKGRASP
jgi:glucokinase